MATSKSLAKDIFADMGRKVAEVSAQTGADDSEPKVVDEIESLCMNCHENVSFFPFHHLQNKH
jgi:zinc finger protein